VATVITKSLTGSQKLEPPPLSSDRNPQKNNTALLTLCALGVVFGDIGTSPLYTLRQCILALHQTSIEAASVLGILSLVFWSLIIVVCLKYLTFIVRADHDGEGGTLAMLALIHTKKPRRPTSPPTALILLVLFGSALLYGDGVITPSISILSAVEGLQIATPNAQPFVVPISLAILVGLFLVQSRGTGQVGNVFGPIMAIWFLVIAVLGVMGITQAPAVLQALNPAEAASFLEHHGWLGMVVLGAVVLCFTGAEALFADLGHFGRLPIQLGWYVLVLPSLGLSYFGQGAFLLRHPTETHTPFFALVPHVFLYPIVGLATIATVIASQALISGTFTLTQQAIHMGYFPRLEVVHTSRDQEGQVYIGGMNYLLMAACILVILAFRSSERLGGAYGLAVIGTMTVTSLTYFVVLRDVYQWPKAGAFALAGSFLVVDLSFLAGNITKIISGAWVPLVIALLVFAVFWIWTACYAKYRRALQSWSMPLDQFVHYTSRWRERSAGTGVFLTTHPDFVPLVGKNHWLCEHVRPEQVLLVTVSQKDVPYVCESKNAKVEEIGPGVHRITASFGFMQQPNVTRVLKGIPPEKLRIDWDKLVVYLPEGVIVEKKHPWWKHRIRQAFGFLGRNSLPAAHYFHVPPNEILHVGVRLEI
jgi:KUP system potassium uptake protein